MNGNRGGNSDSGKNTYLLEIGTEELPVGFLATAPSELTEKTRTTLAEHKIAFKDVSIYATPRRLTLVIEGVADKQDESESVTKGPPVRVALDDQGQPTQAGLGFARKLGIDFSKLKQETLDGETYMVLREHLKGQPVKDVLPGLLPDLVLNLSGSHFMHWGHSTIKFSRPLRWLVSLWNDEHLPVSIGEVASGQTSRGHRILSRGPVNIASPQQYAEALRNEGHVWVDQCERREVILKQLQEAAAAVGGTVPENTDLLETVTMLVETPSVVTGEFDKKYLALPREVTVTVMAAHQKYFPVEKDGQLLPYFLTVSNGPKKSQAMIKDGNQRVLTARFEDARFFFEEDQKIPLEKRLDDLAGVTFQKGLGNMLEKTRRLETLTRVIGEKLGLSGKELDQAVRSATLSKTDLVTGMVRELTELQGVMGRKYAELAGEPQPVCDAVFEQYLPRFMGDAPAKNPVGIALSLADKLDTMVAVFSQEKAKLPSGSKDPLGLRRMAAGVIQTVFDNQLSLDLTACLREAHRGLGDKAAVDFETAFEKLQAFILQRLKGVLLEEGIRYDVIDAVLDAGDPLADLKDARIRMELLKGLTQDVEKLKLLLEPANRIFKILGAAYQPGVTPKAVDEKKFGDPTEAALFKALLPVYDAFSEQAPYDKYVSALSALNGPVEAFFEKVLVNDPDETVKKNRYNLLSMANSLYLRLANFTRLVV